MNEVNKKIQYSIYYELWLNTLGGMPSVGGRNTQKEKKINLLCYEGVFYCFFAYSLN